MVHPIRKIINKFGFDLHRYRPQTDKLTWLKDQNIRTVFDIGANVGQFAKDIRKRLPQAQIYSFEPLKECFDKLKTSFAGDKKFQAFNCALGESEGSLTMNKSSYTLSSSLLPMAESHKRLFPHTKDNKPEEVKICRLDGVFDKLKPEPNILMKADTQGYEDKVIAGGRNAFQKSRVALLEVSFIPLYEGQPLFDDIYQKMRSLGFHYTGALSQWFNPLTGEVIFEDSLFVRD